MKNVNSITISSDTKPKHKAKQLNDQTNPMTFEDCT